MASIFRTSWDSVYRAVDYAVEWGMAHRDLSELTAVGVDEIAWSRGHRYLALVYDMGESRGDSWPWPRNGRSRACACAWMVSGNRPASGCDPYAATCGSRTSK